MNIFEKAFCRVFQFCFKVAIPVLPYREPKALDSIAGVPALLKEKGAKSVLLVTDAGLRSFGITAPLEKLLSENGINCAVYDGTRANPTVANVEEARELYIKEKCECIIAFGGGSPMDCAKAVGARELVVTYNDADDHIGEIEAACGYQWITNFLIHPDYYESNDDKAGYDRYMCIYENLSATDGVVADESAAMNILAAVGRRNWNNDDSNSITVHSAVYNLTDKTVTWVPNENYTDESAVLTFSLK